MAAGSHVPALRRAFGGRPQQSRDAGAEGADAVSMLKLRAGLLGLVAMLLVSSFAAAPAGAWGPWWHHRCIGCMDQGKITGQLPEQIKGQGGEQKLKGKVILMPVTVIAKSVQVKGIIYNNAFQAQAKLELAYRELSVEGSPNCIVTVGVQNTVKVFGHQAWTWNGEKKQLEEQPQQPNQKPDWIFLPQELQQGAESLPKAEFTTLVLTSKNEETEKCAFHGKYEVKGSVTGEITPEHTEEWSLTQTVRTPEGGTKQHFWNGEKNVGVETGLTLGTEPAKLVGEFKTQTAGRQQGAPQEVALFES